MNRQVRQVAVAALVMFVALLINSNVVQVVKASSLRANPTTVAPAPSRRAYWTA